MRQTLFLIPDEWLASIALPLWQVICVIALLIQARRYGWGKEADGMICIWRHRGWIRSAENWNQRYRPH